jgi:ferric-dicitrate binding protein FerR (iron transport regulator)
MLDRGPLFYTHDAGNTAEMTVRSPFGLIAVRGTRCFAGPSNGVFGVFVERGAVMVIGRNTGVLVTDGQGTNIAHPGDEPAAPAPWGAARIAAAMASVQ